MNDPQASRISRAGSNAARAARGDPSGRIGQAARAAAQLKAPSPTQGPLALCIIADRPRDPFYFKPVWFTLSGKCRVGMRSGSCLAEICIAPHSWAVIHGSAGNLEHAMRAAIACDPYVKG